VGPGVIQYKEDVLFAKNMSNIEFVVAQTGNLVLKIQAGTFEIDTVRESRALATKMASN
jgi:hypothetical protein